MDDNPLETVYPKHLKDFSSQLLSEGKIRFESLVFFSSSYGSIDARSVSFPPDTYSIRPLFLMRFKELPSPEVRPSYKESWVVPQVTFTFGTSWYVPKTEGKDLVLD